MTSKKKRVLPPSIRVYFPHGKGELIDMIQNEANTLGISSSSLALMYLKAGRPLVMKSFETMNRKIQRVSKAITK